VTITMATLTFAASGYLLNFDILKLFLLGLPALMLGFWVGVAAYGKLDDAAFRNAILLLLLVSGLSLVAPAIW
jgi:uncharacterized protein